MGRSWQAQSYPRRPDVRLKPIDITLLVGELLDAPSTTRRWCFGDHTRQNVPTGPGDLSPASLCGGLIDPGQPRC